MRVGFHVYSLGIACPKSEMESTFSQNFSNLEYVSEKLFLALEN